MKHPKAYFKNNKKIFQQIKQFSIREEGERNIFESKVYSRKISDHLFCDSSKKDHVEGQQTKISEIC